MATAPTVIAELDRLGPVLCRLGLQRINLSWSPQTGYTVDGRDEGGRYFFGYGDTPSEALSCGRRFQAARDSGGVYVDA